MLNPLAHDFTPISAFPMESSTERTQKTKKKKQPDAKAKSKKTPIPAKTGATSSTQKNKESRTDSKTDQKQQSNAKSMHMNKSRRKSSFQVQPSLGDIFEKESKFITIEAAIDPIHRIDSTSQSTTHVSNNRKQSITSDKQIFEHGYERYINWIDRSLQAFDTVTVVGMENAVVDVVSLVTILQDRKIAAHDDVETFNMNTGHNRILACIQVKLHSYY